MTEQDAQLLVGDGPPDPESHGEGPCWDARTGTLYWVDMFHRALHATNPATGADRIIETDSTVCAPAPRAAGGLIVMLEKRLVFLDPATGATEDVATIEESVSGNRANDAKCDPKGRFWVGTMAIDAADGAGGLYRVDTDGGVTQMLDGVTIGNGLAWSADHATMYYIDSAVGEVWAFDYDAASGDIGNRRAAVTIPEGWGLPDGMSIDSEGLLWVALWGSGRVVRFDPRDGSAKHAVRTGADQTTSCCFGGPDLDQLFITTSAYQLDAAALASQPRAGGVFRAAPRATGLPTDAFGG